MRIAIVRAAMLVLLRENIQNKQTIRSLDRSFDQILRFIFFKIFFLSHLMNKMQFTVRTGNKLWLVMLFGKNNSVYGCAYDAANVCLPHG